MKRFQPVLLSVLLIAASQVFAGGIATNTNQSASYIRNPAQDATISPEATYYNPAATALLDEGFHFSLSNQYIHQVRRIESTSPIIARNEFKGGVTAPLFPTFYGVFRMDQWAVSLGVNPIGGGGSAKFNDGLPSFEQQVASIPMLLSTQGILTDAYSYQTSFEGQSLNWGIQVNGAYQVHDMISVSLGLRYVIANNSYNGYLENLMINPAHPLNPEAGMVSASGFFTGLASGATMVADQLQPFIDDGAGDYTLQQLQAAQLMDEATAQQLAGGLGASYNDDMTLAQVQGAYQVTALAMGGYAQETADKQLDVSQTGSSIVPIIGVNIQVNDDINVGIKYEHKAPIKLKNKTRIDDLGIYPDGATTPSDMPSLISVGGSYRVIDGLTISAGFHYYLDRAANYGKKDAQGEFLSNKDVIDRNFWEAALGVEYSINDYLLVSGGYLRTQTGVNSLYQSDLSHSLTTNTVGAGIRYMATDDIGINFGTMFSFYAQDEKVFASEYFTYREIYNRFNMVVALGIDYKF